MTKRTLILLRHAKSDWYSRASSDFDRPLNKRGRRDAPRVGRWLEENDYQPEVVLCSAARRATQTAVLAGEAAGWDPGKIDLRADLYLAASQTIRTMAEEALEAYRRVMIVGHNPGLELTLLEFCPEVTVPGDGKVMTTAAVAIIEFDFAQGRLGRPRCRLLKRPSELLT